MDPFIGQLLLFGGNFAPRGWALCDGQLLAINSYSALFSILGTTYGGDGRTTFALPDLRSRVPIHPGTGHGLPTYKQGQQTGAPTVNLTVANLPAHNHPLTGAVKVKVADGSADSLQANGDALAASTNSRSNLIYKDTPAYTAGNELGGVDSSGLQVGNRGQNQSFGIVQPSLGVNYIIALVGTYPSRS